MAVIYPPQAPSPLPKIPPILEDHIKDQIEKQALKEKKWDGIVFEKCFYDSRADVLLFDKDNKMTGIEIKSDRDSTKRLKSQVRDYSEVFDYCVLAVGGRLYDKARAFLPPFWGIWVYTEDYNGKIRKEVIREPKQNEFKDSFITNSLLLKLLWCSELVFLLQQRGIEPFTYKSEIIRQCKGIKREHIREHIRNCWSNRYAFNRNHANIYMTEFVPDDDEKDLTSLLWQSDQKKQASPQ